MSDQTTWTSRAVGLVLALGALLPACQSGGVGDPCIAEDEYQSQFPGYGIAESFVESRSFQCETRVCMVNHFQGRVSCPYGQDDRQMGLNGNPPCHIPGTAGSTNPKDLVNVKVNPQCSDRRAQDTVYCSCRCAGSDPNGRYCKCPSGYNCSDIGLPDLGPTFGQAELAGKYCVKQNTEFSPNQGMSDSCGKLPCGTNAGDCGNADGS